MPKIFHFNNIQRGDLLNVFFGNLFVVPHFHCTCIFNRTLTNLPVFPLHCKVKSFLGWQFLSSPLPLFLLLLLPIFPSITKKKDNQFVLLFVFNYFVSFLRLNPKPAKPSIVTKLPATVNKTFCFRLFAAILAPHLPFLPLMALLVLAVFGVGGTITVFLVAFVVFWRMCHYRISFNLLIVERFFDCVVNVSCRNSFYTNERFP